VVPPPKKEGGECKKENYTVNPDVFPVLSSKSTFYVDLGIDKIN